MSLLDSYAVSQIEEELHKVVPPDWQWYLTVDSKRILTMTVQAAKVDLIAHMWDTLKQKTDLPSLMYVDLDCLSEQFQGHLLSVMRKITKALNCLQPKTAANWPLGPNYKHPNYGVYVQFGSTGKPFFGLDQKGNPTLLFSTKNTIPLDYMYEPNGHIHGFPVVVDVSVPDGKVVMAMDTLKTQLKAPQGVDSFKQGLNLSVKNLIPKEFGATLSQFVKQVQMGVGVPPAPDIEAMIQGLQDTLTALKKQSPILPGLEPAHKITTKVVGKITIRKVPRPMLEEFLPESWDSEGPERKSAYLSMAVQLALMKDQDVL